MSGRGGKKDGTRWRGFIEPLLCLAVDKLPEGPMPVFLNA